MFTVSLIVAVYYNMLNAWCVFYIGASFAKDVPWRECDNDWNTNGEIIDIIILIGCNLISDCYHMHYSLCYTTCI